MKQRVDNIRRSVEEKYKLGDQVIITTRRVQNSNMFEVIIHEIFSAPHEVILGLCFWSIGPLQEER